jgi:hypothetical protein
MLSKTELKYLNHGKIYKLVCNVTGDTYYGSTIQSLKERLRMHNKDYKSYLKGKINYVTSFKIIENENYNIHLVEEFRCMNKKQLESIERVYIEGYKCINKVVVGRTRKETTKAYYERNKEKYQEYYENNKDKLTQKFHCPCGGKYTYHHKSTHFKTNKHIKYYKNKIY